jgi:hypothetical protein
MTSARQQHTDARQKQEDLERRLQEHAAEPNNCRRHSEMTRSPTNLEESLRLAARILTYKLKNTRRNWKIDS